eukprot:GGOE01010297.1.p1 GENE.GGOE01010297.1~~GGOE01010297.1.p1  ORF type:complete len:643 (-),score=149.12 GGOE01010297.1:1948-3615(-)
MAPVPAGAKVPQLAARPVPIETVKWLSSAQSLPDTPTSPRLANSLQIPRGILKDPPTPPTFDPDLQASILQSLNKNLRGTAASLSHVKGPVNNLTDPMSPGVQCKACGVALRTEADWELHQSSKEHKKRYHDREQRAVFVTGLPGSVSKQTVASIFHDFELGDDAVEYIANPRLRQGKRDQRQRPVEPHWHVLLRDVDEARRASKMSPFTVSGHSVTIAMAIQPHHCAVCNVTVNSATQLQQHVVGTRHLEVLKQQQAAFFLTVLAVPASATETDVAHLFRGFDIIEGGITFEVDEMEPGCKVAQVTFTSKEACERAALVAEASPTILGQPVHIMYKQGPASAPKLEVPKSGLKTAKEVHMLVCSLLYTHRIADVSEITPLLFGRIHSTFLSCKPHSFAPFRPRDRFFAEFEAQAGSRRGLIPLAEAFAILQQMDQEWSFELPLGVVQWMKAKVAKYCHDSETDMVPKSTFVQIRNLKWSVFQVVEQITEKLAANKVAPPPLLHPMQPLPRTTSLNLSASMASSSSSYSTEEEDFFNVDDQPWDDCSLDVPWVLE